MKQTAGTPRNKSLIRYLRLTAKFKPRFLIQRSAVSIQTSLTGVDGVSQKPYAVVVLKPRLGRQVRVRLSGEPRRVGCVR